MFLRKDVLSESDSEMALLMQPLDDKVPLKKRIGNEAGEGFWGQTLTEEERLALAAPLYDSSPCETIREKIKEFEMEHMTAREYVDRRVFIYASLTKRLDNLDPALLLKMKNYFNEYIIEVGVFSSKDPADPSKLIDIIQYGKLSLLSLETLSLIIKAIDYWLEPQKRP